MQHQEVFSRAWEIATLRKYKKLLWYGFIPALFTSTLMTASYSFRGFQYWFEFFEHGRISDVIFGMLQSFMNFVLSNPAAGTAAVIGLLLYGLGYWLIPVIFQGGLMKLLPEVFAGKKTQFRMGIVYGAQYFFKLFEFKALFSPFRTTWIFIAYWLINAFEPDLLNYLAIPLILWFIIAVVANVLMIFCEYYIVLQDVGVFKSISKSAKLVFLNLEQVLQIIVLMFLIGLRVVINIILTLGIPLLIVFIGGLISGAIADITYYLAIGAGALTLIAIAYVNAIITVFITAAWTMIFLNYTDETGAPLMSAEEAEGLMLEDDDDEDEEDENNDESKT